MVVTSLNPKTVSSSVRLRTLRISKEPLALGYASFSFQIYFAEPGEVRRCNYFWLDKLTWYIKHYI